MRHDDDELDDEDDPENPLPQDMDDDVDAMGMIACPYCRKDIAEEAEWCPHCGKYISREDSPPSRKPLWIFVVIVLVALILLTWAFT